MFSFLLFQSFLSFWSNLNEIYDYTVAAQCTTNFGCFVILPIESEKGKKKSKGIERKIERIEEMRVREIFK